VAPGEGAQGVIKDIGGWAMRLDHECLGWSIGTLGIGTLWVGQFYLGWWTTPFTAETQIAAGAFVAENAVISCIPE
jgi:hypothetical protein